MPPQGSASVVEKFFSCVTYFTLGVGTGADKPGRVRRLSDVGPQGSYAVEMAL